MKPLLGVEEVLWVKRGKGVAAKGKIPQDAEFFKDHFPGFPVLPGVLALEMLRQSAECYHRAVNENSAVSFNFKRIQNVKFSDYLRPGNDWESELELLEETTEGSRWNAKLINNGKVAVSARLMIEPIPSSKTAIAF